MKTTLTLKTVENAIAHIDKRDEAVWNSIHKSTHLTSSVYIPSLRGLGLNPHVTYSFMK